MPLKIRHVDLSGFKSFVDRTRSEFAEGITAIVGPNGCGKSNLVEAITWVLGEQSARVLRGGKMEDVIFVGSERRKAFGMAEVSITLSGDPTLPYCDDQGLITIGRRVFRTGESQYRINGRLVRLKDIRDLLMDTGLGVRAYSVIEQGRIGQILSGRPQDRRKLIEEAAGITRYKQRKHLAELKLEEAAANLLRLDDIVAEVERNLRSLKRQASAASRYQERQAEHQTLLERVLRTRFARSSAELRELERQLAGARDSDAARQAELARANATLVAARERTDELSRELGERHRRHAELQATIQGRQEFLRGTRQTLQELAERLTGGDTLAEQRERERAAAQAALADLLSRSEHLRTERDGAKEMVEDDTRHCAAAEQRVRSAELELETLRAQLLASMNRVAALQNRLHDHQIETEKAALSHDHLVADLAEQEQEAARAREALRLSDLATEGLESAISELLLERSQQRSALDATLRREAAIHDQQQAARQQLLGLDHRRAVLEELERADVIRRERLRATLQELGLGHLRFLDEELEVPPGWEAAIDHYLEQLRDAILVPTEQSPLAVARALRESHNGGTLLGGGDPHAAPPRWNPIAADEAVVSSLGEALSLPWACGQALPPAYLVATPEDAQRLARQHPGVAFLSRDRLWAQGGVLHIQGAGVAPGVLERHRELHEIAQRRPDLTVVLDRIETELGRIVEERVSGAAIVNRLDANRAELRQQLAITSARREDAHREHERLRAAVEHSRGEGATFDLELEQLAERRARLVAELDAARGHHADLEHRFERAQVSATEARAEREARRADGAGRRGRLELLEERVGATSAEGERLERQLRQVEEGFGAWEQQRLTLESRRTVLTAAAERSEAELPQALEGQAGAAENAVVAQEQLEAQRESVRALERLVEELRVKREQSREEIEALRVEQASRRQASEHLVAEYRAASGGADPPADQDEGDIDLPALESELAENKAALERLGPVNVLATYELAEQDERFVFLTEQRADVVTSVTSLKKTIREINETSLERFTATLNEVNERFGGTFARLFRGGEAAVRLMDDEDPLESGIEIIARPPGKRLQNINLMSGGEKALTAIALLFALFGTKPPPFCILDEVDAPLDDVNVARFVSVLREMATETQFLVITHNKLTMEVASTLHGVTMEEKGVSKLVAVEVDRLHPAALAS